MRTLLSASIGLATIAGPMVQSADLAQLFANPRPVQIRGYQGHAMEPFITRDGRYLLFNNLNDPKVDTNLHYAERIDDLTFLYRGELRGVNTRALEGVATVDRIGTLYFVSPRDYARSLSTIYRGQFRDGAVSAVEIVPGISSRQRGLLNFDVEVSPSGEHLYFVDARFGLFGPKTADLVIAAKRDSAFVRLPNSATLLKNVNSPLLDYAACVSADELTLLFTRVKPGRDGVAAIFAAQRNNGNVAFGAAVKLVALTGFVEAPALSPDERLMYFHRRDPTGFAIYAASRRQ